MNIFCLSLHLFGLSCMEQWEEVTIWGWVSWRAQLYNGTCVSHLPLLSYLGLLLQWCQEIGKWFPGPSLSWDPWQQSGLLGSCLRREEGVVCLLIWTALRGQLSLSSSSSGWPSMTDIASLHASLQILEAWGAYAIPVMIDFCQVAFVLIMILFF